MNNARLRKEVTMSQPTAPQHPATSPDAELQAWLQEVETVFRQAEEWSKKRDWATRRDTKTITEPPFGTYQAPVLLIHTPQGRLLLDPIAHVVGGAEGRIDFCVYPSFDGIMLIKTDQGWQFESLRRQDWNRPWSESALEQVGRQMLESP
jgi:hypothetical protein